MIASERLAPPTTDESDNRTAKRPATFFEALELRRPFTPWVHKEGHSFEATGTPPGPWKVEILAKRLEQGLPLWHPDDPNVGEERAEQHEAEEPDSDSDLQEDCGPSKSCKPPRKVALAPQNSLVDHTDPPEIKNVAIDMPDEQTHDQNPQSVAAKAIVKEYRLLLQGVNRGIISEACLESFVKENGEILAASGLDVPTPLELAKVVSQEKHRWQDHLIGARDMRLIRNRLVEKGQILPS